MLLLISDANVLIDIEVGSLTSSMFSLPYQFAVPDVLFHQELQEHHSHLLQCGLVSKTLDSKLVEEAYKLRQQHTRPSMNDLFALSLARYEKCRLLTGDKALREVAEAYLVDVHGTIWLVKQMIEHQKITIEIAQTAFQKMKNSGRRLPWNLIEEVFFKDITKLKLTINTI
jgi:predicted nucleic acid-binding protein